MNHLSERIYLELRDKGWVSTKTLAESLGMNDRALRGEGGPLDVAGDEIFVEHGLVLVSSMQRGVCLTGDGKVIELAANEWGAFVAEIHRRVDKMRRRERMLEMAQLPSLFAEAG